MRISVLVLFAAMFLATFFPRAEAAPSAPNKGAIASVSEIVPAAQKCGAGQRWVPAGYAKRGKYRAGHCAPK
jgi:hypothetical protein